MNIKVLRFINRFNVGGISYNVAYLSKYLSDRYTTKIIGGAHEESEASSQYIFDSLGLSIQILPYLKRSINPLKDLLSLFCFIKILYKYKPTIIHSHASKAGLISRFPLLIYKPNVTVVHTYHGNVFDGYFTGFKIKVILFIERLLAKKTDLIIAISEKQRYELTYKYKIAPAHKIKVVRLGFDLSPYLLVEKSNKNILKSKLGFNIESVIVTIVGRLVPIKNHKLYIDILCELKTKIKNLVGLIVGDGAEMIPLQKYCLNKGLSFSISATDNQFDVKFLSWRKDLPDIYSITDFVLLTSINEGTPVSIIEAMASGCIVLSTDVGGVSDVIEYECGFVCDSNVSSFVKDIVKVYFDSSLKSKISQNARNAVKEKYSYNKLCSNIELEYDELINNQI